MSGAGTRRAGLSMLAAFAIAFLNACGSDGSSAPTNPGGTNGGTNGGTQGGTTQNPALAISLGASTLEVTQGAAATVTVNVTRSGGFTGDVAVTVDGLPTGVTTAGATITGAQTSGTVSLSAAATAAAGNATLTIRASGTGVTAQTASLALTVKVATVTPAGAFSLAASPTSLSIAQGASGSTTINVTRTGSFTGAVALTVSGAPAGLTATLGAASVTGASTTLTLAAAGTLAAGSQTLTIKGTGTGAADQTITVPVTITAATSNPSTGNVTFKFCGASGIPLWVAAQDGAGVWTRVTGTNDTYAFSVAARGGIAYVVPFGTGYDLEVFYGTSDELIARGTQMCNGALGAGKTITSTIAGAASTDIALATLGPSVGTLNLSSSSAVTFNGVPSGNVDLVASKSTFALSGFTPTITLSKLIIRRNVNATGTIPTIDFNAAEAIAPIQKNLTVNNVGSEIALVAGAYLTSNNTLGAYLTDITGGSSASRTYFGVPASAQVAGDLHILSVSALPSLTTTTQTRNAITVFKDAADKSVTLGPALTAPAVSSLTATGYGRARAAITVQSEYGRYFDFDVQQTGANARRAQIQQTIGYANGATVSLDVPDLSAVAGFDVTWGLKVGTSSIWTITATGWTGTGGVATPALTDGATYVTGTRQGNVTP